MKFNDEFKNAELTLHEAVELFYHLKNLKDALRSFEEWKQDVPSITFPVYMRDSVQNLMKTTITNFGIQFPNLQIHFKNGDGESAASARLSSAVLTISFLTEELKNMHYLIRSDDTRQHLKLMVIKSIQHLLLFIFIQYRLHRYPSEEYLPLFIYCEEEEMLPEDFIDNVLSWQKEFDAYPNIYELHSAVTDDFLAVDSELYQKAEELQYPLTAMLAEKALSSAEEMDKLKNDIEKVSRNNISFESNISHEDILRKMQLG